jgi:hypothetical protein
MHTTELPRNVLEVIFDGVNTPGTLRQIASTSRMWRQVVFDTFAKAAVRLLKHFYTRYRDRRLIGELSLVLPGLTIAVFPWQKRISVDWALQQPRNYSTVRALQDERLIQYISQQLRRNTRLTFRVGIQPVDWQDYESHEDDDYIMEVAETWRHSDYQSYIEDAKDMMRAMADHVVLRSSFDVFVYSSV